MDDSKGVKGGLRLCIACMKDVKGRRKKKFGIKQKRMSFFRIYSVPGGDADSMVGRRILDDAGLS